MTCKEIMLRGGKKYAFLLMIDKMCGECGFTLVTTPNGKYDGGHGIRRDGNGVFPPVPCDPMQSFNHPSNKLAFESAHFPADFDKKNTTNSWNKWLSGCGYLA